MRLLLLLPFALAGLAPGSAAQEAAPVVGDQVRIQIAPASSRSDAGSRREGRLAAAGADSIRLFERGTEIALPRAAIARMWVSEGRRSRWRRAWIGALIGGVAGYSIGYAGTDDCTGADFYCPVDREGGAILGAMGGVVLGGAIGYALGGGERWREVTPAAGIRAGAADGGGRAGWIGVSLR